MGFKISKSLERVLLRSDVWLRLPRASIAGTCVESVHDVEVRLHALDARCRVTEF